eukprot:CAMPEP_0172472712 /NCGR_PEP_ID=MMETSP1065-20121228/68484_1 /TAXON_ID=265537 /ORGANISM="Amphiprora paludosa, Strain CCMP125" /LENGTH=719 /DNA_ID=CAMNT_0013230869 /DNA_START=30 /DNA_END=2189 /DNA_ORIENTATION=+
MSEERESETAFHEMLDDDAAATSPPQKSKTGEQGSRTSNNSANRPGEYMDLVTGTWTTKCQAVFEVPEEEQEPAHWWQKMVGSSTRAGLGNDASGLSFHSLGNDAIDDSATVKQYRIVSKSKAVRPDASPFRRHYQHVQDQWVGAINGYMMWTFHAKLWEVVLSVFLFFMVLITLFSIGIFWAGRVQPECMVNGDPEESKFNFVDAYHLSWTTLSTVGYGIIAPGLSSTTEGNRCVGLNILMAFESFVGVLFASVTGAIVFAKIGRIQSIASIVFSDPIVVKYGEGLLEGADDGDDEEDEDELRESMQGSRIPCPALEFRIMNTMWGVNDGEIMNAAVNLVVSRLEHPDDVDRELNKLHQEKKGTSGYRSLSSSPTGVKLVGEARASGTFFQRVNQNIVASAIAMSQPHHFMSNTSSSSSTKTNGQQEVQPINRAKEEEKQRELVQEAIASELERLSSVVPSEAVVVDEGSGDPRLAPKQLFRKLEVETDFHPFFKRTWNIRHVCNEHSPLLPVKVRKMIKKNNGYWPEELNNADEVRRVINFHEIVVSFSGTANDSGSSVYTQKVYSYVDMNVGYTFASILARNNKTGKVIVDGALLNDVIPQTGGRHEPIFTNDNPEFGGYVDPPSDGEESIPILQTISEDEAQNVENAQVPGSAVETISESQHEIEPEASAPIDRVPSENDVQDEAEEAETEPAEPEPSGDANAQNDEAANDVQET